MNKIPVENKEITSDWFSEIFDTQVESCELVDEHSGTTGRAIAKLRYADQRSKQELPEHVFVKLAPTDERQRQLAATLGMGKREARFYRQLSADLPIRVPHCYFSDWNESGDRYVMVLEHLAHSGCTFRPTKQYSLAWIKSVVEEFASLHAQFWNSPRFSADLKWLTPTSLGIAWGRTLIEQALKNHADKFSAVFKQLCELYINNTDAIHQIWQRGDHTLQHGDPHDGNMFLDGDRPGFLDWGVTTRGTGMRDVTYFLAGTIRSDDRDQVTSLLRHYREQLLAKGIDAPPPSELKALFQWHSMYPWLATTSTLGAGDKMQPVNYTVAALNKLLPTLEELDTVSAISAEL